jgi:hypothetical protein
MILKRTIIVYLLSAIITFEIADFNLMYARRQFNLTNQIKETHGNTMDLAINYWNNVQRAHPDNPEVLKILTKDYLTAGDSSHAKESLNKFLCVATSNDPDLPAFSRSYAIMSGGKALKCGRS